MRSRSGNGNCGWRGGVVFLRKLLSERGLGLPEKVTVQVGDPEPRDGVRVRGECWPSSTTSEGVSCIVVNRELSKSVEILGVLLHELIHAADDCRSGHGEWFTTWAHAIGLTDPVIASEPRPRLRRSLQAVAWRLGPYPEARFGYSLSSAGNVVA